MLHADSGSNIGLGHLTRCIALVYEMLENNIEVKLIVNQEDINHLFLNFPKDICIFINKNKTLEFINYIKDFNPEFFIIDSYRFEQTNLKTFSKFTKIIFFDDFSNHNIFANIIINSSVKKNKIRYRHNPIVLSGMKYQVVKNELKNEGKIKIKKNIKKIIVLFGGVDTNLITKKLINFLSNYFESYKNQIEILYVIGPYSQYEIENFKNIVFLKNPSNLVEHMKNSDVALSAGGQTLFELCKLGVPTIAYKSGEDQNQNLKILTNSGAVINTGNCLDRNWHSKLKLHLDILINNYDLRKKMSLVSSSLIDGKGAKRIIKYMTSEFKKAFNN